jgi:hypothetical protein
VINEIGNHDSLMENRGHYYQLIQSQFEGSQLAVPEHTNSYLLKRNADLL